MTFKTDQENFWAGDFGHSYIQRNDDAGLVAANLALFSKALSAANSVKTCIEFGSNVGLNLRALGLLFPNQEQFAVEINPEAARVLENFLPSDHIFNQSILDFDTVTQYELALIKGVLIHINPDFLPVVYEKLYKTSGRYILMCEYYNPSPVMIDYRGHNDRLYKRDFCGELMDAYPSLKLIDYGFAYRRDPKFDQGDLTWFLLEK